VLAQWIMSEKYKGVRVKFYVKYVGRPGHRTSVDTYDYMDNYPPYAGNYTLTT